MTVRYFILFAICIICAAACTPTHNVKPLPNFVNSGLEAGDRVTITTHDDQEHEFVITEIRGDVLLGDDAAFALRDIASIQKHAWRRPESPCGGEKPLGCSLPLLVSLASELHSHYREEFYDACAQHDYCYRHGFASYGIDRKSCDDNFLLDMQNSCPDKKSSGLGKLFETFDGSIQSRRSCLSVADDFYAAVRRYGEEKYTTTTSTYCEYNGPPLGAGLSPGQALNSK
ncbi:MAG: phospholipase [Gammaproteobacteria bacterium]|nr:phospholipase [Gammaproteobacteria bacterium]